MLQLDFTLFPEIETPRLLLRKITLQDAPEILAMRADDDVMRYIGKEKAVSIADAEVFINRIIQLLEINEGITWGIALKENPAILVGTIGLWKITKEHYRAEIGYMLNPGYWKKGIMKEALASVIEAGFNLLKLHTIEAQINPENIASAQILTGAGFIKEAHFKENYFFNNAFSDTAVYTRFK